MAGLALFGVIGTASAQDPSPAAVAIARQVIEVKRVGGMYDPVLIGMIIRARDTFLQTNPMLSGDLNAAAQQLRKDYQPKLDALKEQIAKFYAARFTEQELKDVLAFYRSPVGVKVIEFEPRILEQSMGFANSWAQSLEDEILAAMRTEMRKRGHEL
jgi:hypothetical protein